MYLLPLIPAQWLCSLIPPINRREEEEEEEEEEKEEEGEGEEEKPANFGSFLLPPSKPWKKSISIA